MSQQQMDEETPLLQPVKQKKARTPLPWRQFSIILFLQLAEPLTSQVIAPFAPQLIRDIGITDGDETRVGYYVGLMLSLFFATQALTVLHWSRISDHIGRKPVILTGLFGLSISMYCFGLSRTFYGLVLSRALNGALNGNIGVIKSMMVELTDSTNLAQAYAYMPIAWSSGGAIGPLIGGSLSRPADRFPNIFGHSQFMKTYPYFLACAVPATFSVLAWIVTFLFLQETVPTRVTLWQLLKGKNREHSASLKGPVTSTGSTDSLSTEDTSQRAKAGGSKPLPLRSLLIPRVIIAAGNYAALSFFDIAFRAVQPVFFATPVELGGLGLDPPRIGNILAIYGVINGLFQIFFFADLHDRFGSKTIYSVSMAVAIPMVITLPILNAVARVQGLSLAVWAIVGLQLVLSMILNLAYSCVFIYIAAASPNQASLGATNGIAQLGVSIVRTIGPASATSTFSLSIRNPHHAWIVYYYLIALVCMGICTSLLLPRQLWKNTH
ncbi:major facilitator superfamily domain-containing protein [Suillus fuscotomentosus]|uniref:Major facilitator superfamily domain-containing protein n=1 Tax=Suillus fuscotomentosus TaxID=1912939 RepID=A0AAD4HPF2_9AGAM|nr:major facilitator superfamily domain-containing protein [Suillus fuscotomentosus]KAG1905235.1 major facilitator superfamily domain-containing protein [Suillus fuscotomentosus]